MSWLFGGQRSGPVMSGVSCCSGLMASYTMRWSVVLLEDKRIACNMLDRCQYLLKERVIHRSNAGR